MLRGCDIQLSQGRRARLALSWLGGMFFPGVRRKQERMWRCGVIVISGRSGFV